MTCAMVFVDEHSRSITCIASFADLNGFVGSLTRAAAEMARRQAMLFPSEDAEEPALDAALDGAPRRRAP